MTWSDEVDRAFALRREELLLELVADGRRVVDELGAVVDAVAKHHPVAFVGAGVAAGAGMTMTRGSPPECRSAQSCAPPPRSAFSVGRLIRFGAGLLG